MQKLKTNSQDQLKQSEQPRKIQETSSSYLIQIPQQEIEQQKEVPLNSTYNKQDLVHTDQDQKAKSSLFRYFRPSPDPQLVWEPHIDKQFMSEFQELIENRFNEVKRSSSIYKYYAKIGFQAFIYLLNILEIIFTLSFDSYNKIADNSSYYKFCYTVSIVFCVLLHSGAWMYTYKFREVAKKMVIVEVAYYIYYMLMGALSYFKIAPFIYFYSRDKSIKQFSFSEINKYLQLSGKDKFRNPCMLFKKRTKPVNIFRDLIFHRVALLSMIITMTIQTIPQLFIQSSYMIERSAWDGFNVISFLLLLSNLIYYSFELQFIVFTTTYRQMQTELQFKLKKIKLKFIQETKQLLKSDQQFMEFVESFYFHIDPSRFSPYQKKRCIVQIIFSLIKQKKFQNIEFHFIDSYDEVTLQYLANCFKLINVEKIHLLYQDQNHLSFLQDIFSNILNLTFELQNKENLDNLWNDDITDVNAEEEKVRQIRFIANPKISTGLQVVQQNKNAKLKYINITQHFLQLNPIEIKGEFDPLRKGNSVIMNQKQTILIQNIEEQPQDIINEARIQIKEITKRTLFEEQYGKIEFLIKMYDYYEILKKLNEFQVAFQSISSLLNGSLQIISLIYLTNDGDIYITALIVLTAINPILQLLSFAVFQHRVFKIFSPLRQAFYVLLFAIFNFLKIWDIVMVCLYVCVTEFAKVVKREFSSEGYFKFKSYASKFSGSIATTVFNYENVAINPKNILQIKDEPFYEAVMWRTNVEEALNKVPQFFIYVLSLSSKELNGVWLLSFFQQLKDSVQAIKDILDIVIKDYLIPALILGAVSADQFFQSMLYLSSISNQILLEYPKSFQIVSKVEEQHLQEKLTFKINLKNIDFSNYVDLKKKKMLAQFRYVLASIKSILEIDQAQRLFCMGYELKDLIRCLKVSPLYQLKLNYYLDEVQPAQIPYINGFIKNCPKQLQFLQLQVESTKAQQMEFCVERQETLKAFSYSYFQLIQQYNNHSGVALQETLNIDKDFLKLDRYNFEQFYFEVFGNLALQNCSQLLQQFTQMKVFKASIFNNAGIQTFQFNSNLRSSRLEILDITFENITLDFQEFPFSNLKVLKMILKRCEFNKENLKYILESLHNYTKVVYIDMSQCLQSYTVAEQKSLVRGLESKAIDVFIKI
ncbi:unnamed protein product (macronuclear) [Paramecium tetraurelia]|uniref:Transmembrane protein n=1 Tax=Paramecium tetraurelia TaxID=5888 RepID=A0CZ43_PARTE|nr:uncharacterized protein GSPATT00039098001 [Paramecium tetraurelia]CAK76060.1 unnamed protein product [Paramecium tetraurelia]|eukprot:XP_001443457.1 hypothetical protein (macronuclear) [Paramecium tetraurelia strain d4-2]